MLGKMLVIEFDGNRETLKGTSRSFPFGLERRSCLQKFSNFPRRDTERESAKWSGDFSLEHKVSTLSRPKELSLRILPAKYKESQPKIIWLIKKVAILKN